MPHNSHVYLGEKRRVRYAMILGDEMNRKQNCRPCWNKECTVPVSEASVSDLLACILKRISTCLGSHYCSPQVAVEGHMQVSPGRSRCVLLITSKDIRIGGKISWDPKDMGAWSAGQTLELTIRALCASCVVRTRLVHKVYLQFWSHRCRRETACAQKTDYIFVTVVTRL
jgi:hypothetical protein